MIVCARWGPGQRGRVWGKRSGRLLSEAEIRETVEETANCDLLWRMFTSMSVCAGVCQCEILMSHVSTQPWGN